MIDINTIPLYLLIILVLWEGVWKAIALWKSARGKQLVWFICIIIFNTMGLLPIIYLAFFQKKKKVKATIKKVAKTRSSKTTGAQKRKVSSEPVKKKVVKKKK